jgi:hypothetical protein
MKKILKNISVLALIVGLVVSCAENGEVDYTPKVYAPSSNLTLSTATDFDVDGVTALESSFRVNFSAADDGVAYYAIFPAGSGSPTIEALIRESASSFGDGSVTLTAGATETIIISSNIEPGYSYDVHAVMTSVDGIASKGIRVASFTTPDETAPVFLNGDSVPAIAEEVSFDETSITFAFSEQVYYTGGDITFSAFFGGSPGEIVFTEENLSPSSAGGGTNITFTTDIMWAVFDAYIVTWEAGTFVDNVGLEIEELSGFGHFFYTRDYTFAEVIENNLTGLYDWTLVQNIFNPGFPEAGQYEVTSNGDEITVINALAFALGEDNEHVLRVENDDDGDGVGFLFATEITQESSPGFWGQFFDFSLYWQPYFNDSITALAGFYDFNTGEIIYLFDLADELGWQAGFYLGSFEYTMLPAASRSSSRNEGEGLRNHPVVKKYFEDMEAYRLSQGISQNTTYGPFQLD